MDRFLQTFPSGYFQRSVGRELWASLVVWRKRQAGDVRLELFGLRVYSLMTKTVALSLETALEAQLCSILDV